MTDEITLGDLVSESMPAIAGALMKMREKALSIGVKVGVSTITVLHEENRDLSLTLSRANNTHIRVDVPDKPNANYTAVASAKIAQMMRTGEPSGRDDGFFGEVPYRGGLTFKNERFTVFVAYSGGTEDEDAEIAQIGIEHLAFL